MNCIRRRIIPWLYRLGYKDIKSAKQNIIIDCYLKEKNIQWDGLTYKQRRNGLVELFNTNRKSFPPPTPSINKLKKKIPSKRTKKPKKEFYTIEKDNFVILMKNGKKLPYSKYLKTKHWKTTRNKVMKEYNKICFDCMGVATQVHHLTYENLGKEKDEDLIPLCNDCHEKRHKL